MTNILYITYRYERERDEHMNTCNKMQVQGNKIVTTTQRNFAIHRFIITVTFFLNLLKRRTD